MSRSSFLLIISLVLGSAVFAQVASAKERDQSPLGALPVVYYEDTLKSAREVYRINIEWNYRYVVVPVLSTEEKQGLELVTLGFPSLSTNLLGIGFDRTDGSILMPVQTIKLVDDLFVATDWLGANGYDESTVSEYALTLKYCSPKYFPQGRFPEPRDALGIPESALKDPRVDMASQNQLKGTVVYLLGQGISALTLGPQREPSDVTSNLFGLEILRRLGVPPVMLPVYFDWKVALTPNIADFHSRDEYRQYATEHPLTVVLPDTLRALARQIRADPESFARIQDDPGSWRTRIMDSAKQLSTLAQNLENRQLLESSRDKALKCKPETLRPRKPSAR